MRVDGLTLASDLSLKRKLPYLRLSAYVIAGVAIAAACYWASGVSLGLFFGPVLLATFAVPYLVVSEVSMRDRAATCFALFLGIWSVWLVVGHLAAFDAMRVGGVLLAYLLALGGGVTLLQTLRIDSTFASILTVFVAFAWLTWPVWLCPWLGGPHVDAIVRVLTIAHPLLTLNGVLVDRFGAWDRYPLAYQQLTTLNQDILYQLPTSVWPSMLLHTFISLIPMLTKPGFSNTLRHRRTKGTPMG